MNTDEVLEPSNSAVIKRNRFFGLLIIVIVVAPMGLAYLMYNTGWGVSNSTTNKGQLLSPAIPLQELVLSDQVVNFTELYRHQSLDDKAAGKKWRLLVPVTANCSDICKKNLYTTRQVHIRLAEKAYRVERILLSLNSLPTELLIELDEKHPSTLRAATTEENFAQWLAASDVNGPIEQYYYLVDQEGFVMMRYDVSHTGHDLLDDIKKLLKFTYDK